MDAQPGTASSTAGGGGFGHDQIDRGAADRGILLTSDRENSPPLTSMSR